MTWKLSVAFYELRKRLGKLFKNKPERTGEFLMIAKVDEVDFEGKSPTDIKIYFDQSLHPRQCQAIATECAGAFLAVARKKEAENATKEENRQEPKPQEAPGREPVIDLTQSTKPARKNKFDPVELKIPVRGKSTAERKKAKAIRQNRKAQNRQGKGGRGR
jgi:hypothetical protein